MGSILTLQGPDGEATMSSREIAELTGKQHQHVRRDIEKMFMDLQEDPSSRGRIYIDAMNRQQHEFLLDRELTETLLTGYSTTLRRKVIARWRELEARALAPAELSRIQILEMAMQSERDRLALEEQLAAAAPAVEFVERYADSTGTKGFRQVAKLLGANEHRFREFLIDEKIMYRLGRELTPHSQHIDAGRFCVKAGTSLETGHAYNSARFTPKGVTWVAGEWAKWQLAQREEGGHA